jgi:hypothetical protein
MKVKISLVVVFATLFAASLAFADGYNLVGWPLEVADTAVQPVMADSMGTGCQLTGGYPATNSDQIKYYDASTTIWSTAWYKQGGPGPQNQWFGTLTTIEPDKGYWIIIKGTHPAVTLTMTGSVNVTGRTIPIQPGPSNNYVASLFAVSRPLGSLVGEDFCNLVGSGFTGGYPATSSDKVRYFDGASWYAAWWKVGGPGASNLWKGSAGPTGLNLEPGNGYIIDVLAGHSFIANTWSFIPPAKGAKTDLSGTTRTIKREVSSKVARALGPSTNKSLAREHQVEEKRTR